MKNYRFVFLIVQTNFMEPYKPTSRDFYEELELLSMQKKTCHISFKADNGAVSQVNAPIVKLFTKEDGAEYLVLGSNLEVRLDRIINIEGKNPQHYC